MLKTIGITTATTTVTDFDLANVPTILPGQVRLYCRDPFARGEACNTAEEQAEFCMQLAVSLGFPVSETDIRAEAPGHSGLERWDESIELDPVSILVVRAIRPVLGRLMEELKAGEIKVLVVSDVDRVSRCDLLLYRFLKHLDDCGVILVDRFGIVDTAQLFFETLQPYVPAGYLELMTGY